MTLQDKSLPRCMKPKDFGNITNCTLQHFSDASQTGYGQCSYIKLVNDRAQIHCCLLIGKSRVTPLNFISIPSVKLTAAALSVKISKMLREELDVHVDDEIFWTDGQVVLGYINNDVRGLKCLQLIAFNKFVIIPVQSSGISLKAATILQAMLLVT